MATALLPSGCGLHAGGCEADPSGGLLPALCAGLPAGQSAGPLPAPLLACSLLCPPACPLACPPARCAIERRACMHPKPACHVMCGVMWRVSCDGACSGIGLEHHAWQHVESVGDMRAPGCSSQSGFCSNCQRPAHTCAVRLLPPPGGMPTASSLALPCGRHHHVNLACDALTSLAPLWLAAARSVLHARACVSKGRLRCGCPGTLYRRCTACGTARPRPPRPSTWSCSGPRCVAWRCSGFRLGVRFE